MFIRTGPNDYELAVVVSDPNAATDGTIGVIAIESILNLQHTDREITLNPAQDFINGYDAGRVDVSAEQLRRIRRWVAAGQIITIYTTASGAIRFGRVPREKLGLTAEQTCWLEGWRDSMDYEAERKRAEVERQRAAEAERRAAVKAPAVKKAKKLSLEFDRQLRREA